MLPSTTGITGLNRPPHKQILKPTISSKSWFGAYSTFDQEGHAARTVELFDEEPVPAHSVWTSLERLIRSN
jgi:hypothetical protein